MSDMPAGRPMRVCMLGCGRVAETHAGATAAVGGQIVRSFASR